jgi:F0F1-type ATP synthase alpha subunit
MPTLSNNLKKKSQALRRLRVQKHGRVLRVGDGVAEIEGLEGAVYVGDGAF